MFRWPKDTVGFNAQFYQRKYREPGLTTDLPDRQTLERLLAAEFAGTDKDFHDKIEILKRLVPSGKVLDFGCSWGYGVFQLRTAGYDAMGFEISKPRASFGRRELGITILEDYDRLAECHRGQFDAIFCSHVLEHLPTLDRVFDLFCSLLKPGGLLLVFVPNCGGDMARQLGVRWGPMLCEKHSLALDEPFFRGALPRHGFSVRFASSPYDTDALESYLSAAGPSAEVPSRRSLTRGEELLVCAWKVPGRKG